MLSVGLRATTPVDFKKVLQKYIQATYSKVRVGAPGTHAARGARGARRARGVRGRGGGIGDGAGRVGGPGGEGRGEGVGGAGNEEEVGVWRRMTGSGTRRTWRRLWRCAMRRRE
jgi:hypothetical protein